MALDYDWDHNNTGFSKTLLPVVALTGTFCAKFTSFTLLYFHLSLKWFSDTQHVKKLPRHFFWQYVSVFLFLENELYQKPPDC